MGGKYNGTPAPSNWIDCYMNLCTIPDSKSNIIDPLMLPKGSVLMYPANGNCPTGMNKTYGPVITTTKASCDVLGGAYNGSPNKNDWVGCHMNVCTVPTDHKTPIDVSGLPIGMVSFRNPSDTTPSNYSSTYGAVINSSRSACDTLGGRYNGSPAPTDWVDCYMNMTRKMTVTVPPTVPAPTVSTPTVSTPTVPAPTVPAPTVPAPTVPTPQKVPVQPPTVTNLSQVVSVPAQQITFPRVSSTVNAYDSVTPVQNIQMDKDTVQIKGNFIPIVIYCPNGCTYTGSTGQTKTILPKQSITHVYGVLTFSAGSKILLPQGGITKLSYTDWFSVNPNTAINY
jgi:hypothetical protein